MMIDEITKDIVEKENKAISEAFTLCIGKLLIDKKLTPIMEKQVIIDEHVANKSELLLQKEYGIRFTEIDTTEHDKEIATRYSEAGYCNGYEDGYNKAIDDVGKYFENLINKGIWNTSPFIVKEYLEKLKDGGNDETN